MLANIALRQEFTELNTRYRRVAEMRDLIGEKIVKCRVWISEQKNFEDDEFLKFMALAVYKVCQEKILETAAELQEIQPRIQALQASVANRSYRTVNSDGKVH